MYVLQIVDIEGTMSLTEGKGTCAYMEPRVTKVPNDKASDLFSYCMMASEVLTGKWVPRHSLINLVHLEQSGINPRPPFPKHIPDEIREELLSGFDEDLSKRPTWEQLMKELQVFSKELEEQKLQFITSQEDILLKLTQLSEVSAGFEDRNIKDLADNP